MTSELQFDAWTGQTELRSDLIDTGPARRLCATLGIPAADIAENGVLPLLWHWLYFLPEDDASKLDEDGHARKGGFLPPVPLPRRMWAGSELGLHENIHFGDTLTRSSRVTAIEQKSRGESASVYSYVVQNTDVSIIST